MFYTGESIKKLEAYFWMAGISIGCSGLFLNVGVISLIDGQVGRSSIFLTVTLLRKIISNVLMVLGPS